MDEPPLAQIRSNVDLVMAQLGKLSEPGFGLNKQSIAWVEGFIERQRLREELSDDDVDGMISTLGCFLGEAIIDAAGGAWAYSDGALGIRFGGDTWCFPFSKVAKQFESGLDEGESILSFYEVAVDQVATGKLNDERR